MVKGQKYFSIQKLLEKPTVNKLTKQQGEALGFHRNTVADLIKRGAIVIDGIVYAPVKKRKKT